MKPLILPELELIKKQTDFMINYKEVLENKDIEKYLRSLEKIRYDMFNKLKINNEEKIDEKEKINYINNSYKATLQKDILNRVLSHNSWRFVSLILLSSNKYILFSKYFIKNYFYRFNSSECDVSIIDTTTESQDYYDLNEKLCYFLKILGKQAPRQSTKAPVVFSLHMTY